MGEEALGKFLAPLGFPFSPVLLLGDVADSGFYSLPQRAPVTTETATYTAAGTPVSSNYTGISLWGLLNEPVA